MNPNDALVIALCDAQAARAQLEQRLQQLIEENRQLREKLEALDGGEATEPGSDP